MRFLSLLLAGLLMTGCVTQIHESRSIEMMPRDGRPAMRGAVSSQFPDSTRYVIDIDRRIYAGTAERTVPNSTFGLALAYGRNPRATDPAGAPVRRNYFKAILSSADNHFLRCDLAGDAGRERDGLCVDDSGRVFDVLLSQ